ncbi:MAG: BirA family transcriptional/ biotin-[acetyl-CoA-carboxylase] ligase [Chloroflexi bacterium]|nr:MAG: BirA family transcriptional/ biotin-[acetyl-CoA-carboxylase] ligase [Chloroflexota bacterium]
MTILDSASVRSRLNTKTLGRKIVSVEVTSSTMEDSQREAAAGAEEGLVIVAEEQRGGHGRMGRPWRSPPGNLYLSVVFRPSEWELRRLGMAACLAVAEAIQDAAPLSPALKWPNDVLINKRKVAGLIIEVAWRGQQLDHAVLGIGINVALNPDDYAEISGVATSVNREAGMVVSREDLLLRLLERLDTRYDALKSGQSPLHEWSARLDTLGRWVKVTDAGEPIEGQAIEVDENGGLVLALADGSLRVVTAGQIGTD